MVSDSFREEVANPSSRKGQGDPLWKRMNEAIHFKQICFWTCSAGLKYDFVSSVEHKQSCENAVMVSFYAQKGTKRAFSNQNDSSGLI